MAQRAEMRQLTLATGEFRHAALLAEMDRVVPWHELRAVIEPFYPKPGNGRPPVGLERIVTQDRTFTPFRHRPQAECPLRRLCSVRLEDRDGEGFRAPALAGRG